MHVRLCETLVPIAAPPPMGSSGDLPLLFTACVLPSMAGQLIDVNLVILCLSC